MESAGDLEVNTAIEISNEMESEVTVIEPTTGWRSLQLRELWRYRELLVFLLWRNIKVRYKQTIIGVGWAVLQPFTTMIAFSLLFGRLAQIPSDGIPYPLFSYTALVPWTFFAKSLGDTTSSIVQNTGLIKKIYFPRLVLPISAVLSGLVDFVLAFGVLLLMLLYFVIVPQGQSPHNISVLLQQTPSSTSITHFMSMFDKLAGYPDAITLSPNIVFVPFFVLLAMITALGVGLWFAALNVRFRDVQYLVPFLIQLWLFATPIVYPVSMIPEQWRGILALNPMAGVVEGFRWSLLNQQIYAPGPFILISSLASLLVLISGAFYFRRMEKLFADVS